MKKVLKSFIIDQMITALTAGVDRAGCLAQHGTTWHISRRTFARYWKIAKQKHDTRQAAASKLADDAYAQQKIDAVVKAVMTKQERLEILTQIALGKLETEIKKPSWDHQQKKFVIVTVLQAADVL
jgi:hypothetical protein